MKKLDYWLGVPLCFLLKVIDCVFNLIPLRSRVKAPENFLFIKLSEMGAIVLALPLIEEIKKKYPKSEIYFITFRSNTPLFRVLDIVPYQNVLSIRDDSFISFFFDTLKVIKEIRRKGIDVAFDLEFFARFTAILNYLSGAKRRIGFYRYNFEGLYRGNLLTHNFPYNPLEHISKMYLSFSRGIELEKKVSPEVRRKLNRESLSLPKANLSNQTKEKVLDRLKEFGIDIDSGKKLFLINPGDGNLPLREWSIDNFIELSRMLLEDSRNYIVIVGSKDARKKSQKLLNCVKSKRCIDFAGETELEELLILFDIAAALVANDCGIAHLASLVPIKKFVLFGPESPSIFGSLGEDNFVIYSNLPCSPCFSGLNHRTSLCKDNKCLKVIEPEEMYNLIKRNL